MKLEVGMYLRHSGLEGEYPIIQKITELKTPGRCGGKYKVYTDKCEDWFIDSDYIELNKSKYSHNIIDLIEVGDIITYEFPTGLGMLKYENVTILERLLEVLKSSDEYTILSIVTKEQFESMSYKL